jgi:hypothetical protein
LWPHAVQRYSYSGKAFLREETPFLYFSDFVNLVLLATVNRVEGVPKKSQKKDLRAHPAFMLPSVAL